MGLNEVKNRVLGALDRNQTVRDEIVREWAKALPKGARVLDIGAGSLRYRPDLAHCVYVAQDHPSVTYAPPGVELVRSDILSIPLETASIDAILCTEVLEHVEDPLRAVEEFSRLLKPGGSLLLTVPAACRVHRVPTHYWGGFAPDFFEKSMPARGLVLDRLHPMGNWSEFMAQELGRVPDVLRNHTSLPRWVTGPLSAASWPLFRLAVPASLLLLAKVDTSDDLPIGWVAFARRASD